jgi:hypothetical protein
MKYFASPVHRCHLSALRPPVRRLLPCSARSLTISGPVMYKQRFESVPKSGLLFKNPFESRQSWMCNTKEETLMFMLPMLPRAVGSAVDTDMRLIAPELETTAVCNHMRTVAGRCRANAAAGHTACSSSTAHGTEIHIAGIYMCPVAEQPSQVPKQMLAAHTPDFEAAHKR